MRRGMRKMLRSIFLAILILVGLALGFLWFGGQPERDVIYLKADKTPFRVKPTAKSPKGNSTFYDYLDQKTPDDETPEILTLPEDAPELPPIDLTQEAQPPQPQTQTQPPKPQPQQPAPKPQPVPDTATPSMVVQLAAFQSQAKAETAAALLSQKHKTRLAGHSLKIQPVVKQDSGQDKGTFWRVLTATMSAEMARALCTSLKQAGQDCIVRRASQP